MSGYSDALAVAKREKGLHYYNPVEPFMCRIPSGLSDGSKVYVHGFIPPNCKRFSINLLKGSDSESDVIFHVNPRFDEKDIVMNSKISEEWGSEKRSQSLPLRRMASFVMCITSLQNGYEVEVDDAVIANFEHRVPYDEVKCIRIHGDVDVEGVHILDKKLLKERNFSLTGGLKPSQVFTIDGECSKDFSQFAVNFQCGDSDEDDIAFHFNPRGGDVNQVIRNSNISGSWGDEEREGDFPFSSGEKFVLKVAVSEEEFSVCVNGKPLANYKHRLPASKVCAFKIKDDVKIRNVVCEIPSGTNRLQDYIKVGLQDPILPAKLDVNGFKPGSFLSVVGSVKGDPSRFKINLQAGPSDDVMLHVNPRWDDGDKKIVLNSREGGNWADEEMWQSEFPLAENARFEIVIECQEEGYRIEINGDEQLFKHRLSYDHVKLVSIDGSVDIQKVIVA